MPNKASSTSPQASDDGWNDSVCPSGSASSRALCDLCAWFGRGRLNWESPCKDKDAKEELPSACPMPKAEQDISFMSADRVMLNCNKF
eukprot:XP_001705658.1 Hypothetical protein GL50803_88392 [Giardia lamblia ATCC 50803]